MRRFRFRSHTAPMTCHEAGTVLQAYLDGELDEANTRRVSDHLAVCLRCGLDRDVYVQIKDSLGRRSTNIDDQVAFDRLRSFAEELAAGNGPVDVDDAITPAPRSDE